MTKDELLALACGVGDGLAANGVHPRLIGGVAIQCVADGARERCEAALGHDVELLPLVDPRHLAALPRVTDDLDLVVPSTERSASEETLRGMGFLQDAGVLPPPLRYRNDGSSIDLVVVDRARLSDPRATELDLDVALASVDAAFDTQRDPRSHLFLARPAALVVLKAVAYRNRWFSRDLGDFARLALLDVTEGQTRSELVTLWHTLPSGLKSCVRAVRDLFGHRDADGPSAFIATISDQLPALSHDSDLEDDVRDAVVGAVSALIDGIDDA